MLFYFYTEKINKPKKVLFIERSTTELIRIVWLPMATVSLLTKTNTEMQN